MLIKQWLTKPFTSGETENAEGVMLTGALRGSRLLDMFAKVPWHVRNRAHFDEVPARIALKTRAGRELFDTLCAETLLKVPPFSNGGRGVVMMASAVALWHEAKAAKAGARR